MKALVVGATGLIGARLLQELLANERWQSITVLSRRPLAIEHPKLAVQLVDFASIAETKEAFDVQAVFSCLGTTLAAAGSKEAFRTVDYEYNLAIAKLALAARVNHYLLVSAYGANSRSPFFYNRVKGELETAIESLPLERITFMQPSLLLGARQERRLAEQLAGGVANAFKPLWRKGQAPWWPIDSDNVAIAMAKAASAPEVYRVERWQHADIMAAVNNNGKEK